MARTQAAVVGKGRRRVGLGKLLKGAHGAFNRSLRTKLAANGITFSQFQHLQNLWKEDGINQTELSRRIGITTASSTDVLDSLEQLGLIHRIRSKSDRRKISVFLTPAGADLEDPLEAYAIDVNVIATEGLTEPKIKELYGLLAQVIQNLRAERDALEDEDV